MQKVANIAYVTETESYLEKNRDSIPKNVYEFIKEVCQDERKYLDLVQQWSKEKKVLKVPEAKAFKY